MIMPHPSAGGSTTVDCQKQVRSWRLLRSLAHLLLPTCNCMINITQDHDQGPTTQQHKPRQPAAMIITGTLFGRPRGRVNLCIQTNPNYSSSSSPILLLELSIPTNALAREMRRGSVRFAFECMADNHRGPLLLAPLWAMYCNGRKVGFAVRRKKKRGEVAAVLRRIEAVVVGAGVTRVVDDEDDERGHDVMYLRGKFERFHGSANAESFHLVDPGDDGGNNNSSNNGQELSFYFLRSC